MTVSIRINSSNTARIVKEKSNRRVLTRLGRKPENVWSSCRDRKPGAGMRAKVCPASRPLDQMMLEMRSVKTVLNVSEDRVIQLIECGALLWAWNIAVKCDARREVRVLSRSVDDYVNGRRTYYELPELLEMILPKTHSIQSVALERLLHCSGSHIGNLIKTEQLRPYGELRCRRGPNGGWNVSMLSLARFLGDRRVL